MESIAYTCCQCGQTTKAGLSKYGWRKARRGGRRNGCRRWRSWEEPDGSGARTGWVRPRRDASGGLRNRPCLAPFQFDAEGRGGGGGVDDGRIDGGRGGDEPGGGGGMEPHGGGGGERGDGGLVRERRQGQA